MSVLFVRQGGSDALGRPVAPTFCEMSAPVKAPVPRGRERGGMGGEGAKRLHSRLLLPRPCLRAPPQKTPRKVAFRTFVKADGGAAPPVAPKLALKSAPPLPSFPSGEAAVPGPPPRRRARASAAPRKTRRLCAARRAHMFPGRGRCRTGTRTKPCQAAPGGAGRGAAGSVCALCAPQAAAHGFRRSPSYSPARGTQTHGRTAAIGAARVRRGAHAPLIPAEGSRSREPGPQQPLASRHSAPGCAFPLPDPLKCFLAWRAGLSTYISNLMAHKLLAKGFHYSPSVSYKGEKKITRS